MDDRALHLEEYKVLLATISHIFQEFWMGNAFFISFFSLSMGALTTNFDKVKTMPLIGVMSLATGLGLASVIWVLTNVKHDYYLQIHIAHAVELESKWLGCSIFTRRRARPRGLARVSVRKLWIAAPIVFFVVTEALIFAGKFGHLIGVPDLLPTI